MVLRAEQFGEIQDRSLQHLIVTTDQLGGALIEVLNHVIPLSAPRPVALHEPDLGELEQRSVTECVRSGWVSSVGEFVTNFETMLRDLTGSSNAVAIASGTSALQLALRAVGVRPGDEVITPALTFVATANAVSHCGAVPHFVDSEETTLGLDPVALSDRLRTVAVTRGDAIVNRETERRIAAVIPMHTFGLVSQVEKIVQVASSFGIPVIEDAAEAIGASSAQKHCGRFGQAGMLSFNGNKVVTTGNGGAILTEDDNLADQIRHLSTTAKVKHPWRFDHDQIGWNYRLPNLNAALGCAQLSRLREILHKKRALHKKYQTALTNDGRFRLQEEMEGTESNYWLNSVRVLGASIEERDTIIGKLHGAGYACRPAWTLMHRLPMYASAPRGSLTTAELLEQEIICLPSGPRIIQ